MQHVARYHPRRADAPDIPILVTPPDGSTAETLDVEVTVEVTDPGAEMLSVSDYGSVLEERLEVRSVELVYLVVDDG